MAHSLSYEGYIGVANVFDDAIVDNVRINAFGGRYRHTIIAMDGRTEAAAGLAQDVRFAIHPLLHGC